jgi:sec-independent protein translocase protein TatB
VFNLGAWEVLVIALLALVVLGPQRLPEAARQIGQFMGEIRKLSSGFQRELKSAFDDETEKAARVKGAALAAKPPVEPVEAPAVEPPPAEAAAPTTKKAAAKKAAAKKAGPTKRAAPLRAPRKEPT